MTYEEHRAMGTMVAERMPTIAKALSRVTAQAWTASVEKPDIGDYRLSLSNAEGWALWISLSWHSGPGKLSVSPIWPRDKSHQTPYLRDGEKVSEIRVSVHKSDDQIAKDIARRLLPGYGRTFALVIARNAEANDRKVKALADAERIASACAGEVRRDRGQSDEQHAAKESHIVSVKLPGVWTVEVTSSGVKLDMRYLDVDAAVRLVGLLAEVKAERGDQ